MNLSAHRVASRFLATGELPSKADILKLRTELAKAAQKAYDKWDVAYAEELGEGGICQDIAEEIAQVLDHHGVESGTISASIGDQHVYAVAKIKEGVFEIDINPRTYERGSGYKWTKIPDVTFDANDISVALIHNDPDKFDEIVKDF